MKPQLILVLAVFVVISCGRSKNYDAASYNNAIIGEQSKVISLILEMAQASSENLEKAMEIRLELAKQARESYGVVKEMPSFGGDPRFRDAAVELFAFYIEVSEVLYKELLQIRYNSNDNPTLDDLSRMRVIVDDLDEKEQNLDKMLQKAQAAFARKHGLVIENSELQKEIDAL